MKIQKLIALEGMPLSGKTSSWNKLNKSLNHKALFFDEIFFDETVINTLGNTLGNLDAQKWFFDQEVKRTGEIHKSGSPLVILDRTYLSTLAYTYARSMYDKNPQEFTDLLKYYEKIKHRFPEYDHIFILDNEVATTHERRQDKQKEQNKHWMSQEFMQFYRDFYKTHAKKYTNAKIVRLYSPDYSITDLVEKVASQVDLCARIQASVIVSVHNDEQGLKKTLDQLEKQSFDKKTFEVIVVDNASKKNLEQFVNEYQKKSQLHIKFVQEPVLGLSKGRNTGAQHAIGSILLFTDAHSEIDPNWITKIVAAFAKPDVKVVGGKVTNKYSQKRPESLPQELEAYFAPTSWPKKQIPVKKPYYIIGANIAILKKTFSQLNGFKLDLGRIGNSLLSCEDIELFLRVQREFGENAVIIEPQAIITHITEPKDYTFVQLLKKGFWQGVSEKKLTQHINKNVLYTKYNFGLVVNDLLSLFVSLLKTDRRKIILHSFNLSKIIGFYTQK